MTRNLRRAIIVFVLMCAASLAAHALKPTNRLVDQLGKLDLEAEIPKEFGDWVMDTRGNGTVVNPQQTELLNKLYSQTLARTYVNRRTGEFVMLSIAYGEDQRDGMAMHYPEVCYPAQGFQLKSNVKGNIQLPQGQLLVRRLETFAGPRSEPVSYWTMIGQHSTLGGLDKKLTEMKYSLRGEIPDGLLFRVSSINRESARAFETQSRFIASMLPTLAPNTLSRVASFR